MLPNERPEKRFELLLAERGEVEEEEGGGQAAAEVAGERAER